ncbi:MAG: AsmA-like C-terminal region-containing protein, partial [Crocinitomicaceae bacterium]
VHPLKFENFNGRVHYENDHLNVEDFHGKLGKSIFNTSLSYYLGDNVELRKKDNHFTLTASRLDIDQIIKHNPQTSTKIEETKVDHDDVFNIYELPFTDMTYHLDIDHLNYHRYLMHNIKGEFRTTPEHYIHLDKLDLDAAGGHFDVKGYVNGSNPNLIYFSPDINVTDIDLDKLLFKFENFGQDHIVSENLHGKFTGRVTGKIHMHTDMVPKIDDSEIHLDAHVLNGRLENYGLLDYMTDYFQDKNLKNVVFDTLDNHMDLTNGILNIPTMSINSSLGHLEISGKQSLEGEMEYYLRIPWKMITQTASSKLYGKKEKSTSLQEDEIQYGDAKTKYVNIRIVGDTDDYKLSLGKPKKKKKDKS